MLNTQYCKEKRKKDINEVFNQIYLLIYKKI